jgi:hypothetical protein
MKRLLLVALMVLVTLIGMVGFSRAGNAVSALQATAKATNGAVTEPPATINAGDKYRAYYDPKEGVTEPPATINAGDKYRAYYDPKEGVTEPPATINAGDKYRAYYDPKEGVTEPPATVNAGDKYRAYYDPKEAVAEPPAPVNAGLPAKPKMYYLTVTGFTGVDAITACDSGFHMASLSEIQDPSNVQYAHRSTTVSDSLVALMDSPPSTRSITRRATVSDSLVALMDSPPSTRSTTRRATVYDSPYDSPPLDQTSDQFPDHTGWVRTEADPLTGYAYNCDDWESSSDQQSGTTMTRRSNWGENNGHSLYEESDPAAWWQSTRTASCSEPEPVWCVEDPVMTSAICTATIDQQGGDCI